MAADKPAFVRPLEDAMPAKRLPVARLARLARAEQAERPVKPRAIAGHRWHWYEKAWVSVPEPVHICDDHVVRIEAQKAGQKLVFCPLTSQMVKAPQSQPA